MTPSVPYLIPKHQKSTSRGLKLEQECRKSPFTSKKTTIESRKPNIDPHNEKSNPKGPNRLPEAKKRLPKAVSPKADFQMRKIKVQRPKTNLQRPVSILRGVNDILTCQNSTLKGLESTTKAKNRPFVSWFDNIRPILPCLAPFLAPYHVMLFSLPRLANRNLVLATYLLSLNTDFLHTKQ